MINPIINEVTKMSDALDENEVNDYIKSLIPYLASPSVEIIGLAAGRMGYALRSFIMRLSHMGFNASMIGDTNVPRVKENSVIFVNSSSGETPSIVLYVEQAAKENGKIFLTSCEKNSTIAKFANSIIQIPKINSVQLMKSPYEQFSMLLYDYFIFSLVESLGLDKNIISNNHSILE